MKRRNVMVILLALIALLTAFALCACGGGSDETPTAEGPETGEYYCDAASGAEYTISLHDGDKVDFKVQNYDLKGTYTVSGENLSFAFEAEPHTVTASLRDDVLTVTLGSDVMRFWKKIPYSVVYMSEGAQYKTETVVNGKSATRPDNPVKTNYVFIEWYSDSSYREVYDFTQPVRGDLTLYARFEAPIEPEFNVTLDYNGGNVTGPATVETVGGKLYALPKPTRDGYTFAGWWVSHFDDAEKLTYRYEEQLIDEPITLYAVWSDGETPLVSIYEDGLRWSADGVNNSYRVKFTGPSGEEITNRSYGTTSFSYDFSQKTAGEYVAEVTLNGKTAKAYYNNKALAAVSAWSIDNSLFRWNAVPHAESYTLSVECGDPNHFHSGTVVSAADGLKFDFSGCDMPADGIKITVEANAEGYLSSTSQTFKVTRTLDKVQNVTVEETTATLKWDAVKNATGYVVSVLQEGASEPAVYPVGAGELSYDLRTLERGTYTVSVLPTARGWLSPDASAYSYQKVRLASPSNIRVEGLSVVWDEIDGANSYTVTINGKSYPTDAPSYDLKDIVIGSGITVSVVAADKNNAAITSPASEELTIKNGTMGSVKYGKGKVTWDAVLGATEYVVKVNEDGAEETVSATSLDVTLTKKGDNVIYVRAILDNGGKTDWANCTVTAHAIEFSVGNGNIPVPPLYFAEEDTVEELPEGYRTGYNFVAWYTEETEGTKYEGGSMGNVDLTLYPRWEAKKYTLTLNAGTYGTLEADKLTFEVTFDQMYTLPVPESSNPTKAFAAWRSSQGGTGDAYTDFDGNSNTPWTGTQGITLYAQWVEVFEFTLNPEKTGWSVSKGDGIQYVRKVTIPEEYGDATSGGLKPVLTVNDFSNCKLLEEINIPARVENIALGGTQSVAFMGCTNLQAVNIYLGTYSDKPVYASEDGVLLRYSESTDTQELVFYPLGKTTDEYTVPDSVQSILDGVFKNAKFSKVTIPASVTLIETDAFASCANLTEVKFLAAEEESRSIEIQTKAFDSLGKLQTVTLPDRLTTFSSDIFYSCKALLNVYIVNATKEYSSTDDGLLIKTSSDGTRELAYYAYGRSGEFTVPQGVTSIGSDAIARIPDSGDATKNEQITKVTIPSWVTNIADKAFKDCINLTEVTFLREEGTDTPLNIGEGAFFKCSLQSITLPNVRLSIGDKAFYGRSYGLTSSPVAELTLPEKLTHVGSYAFGNLPLLTAVTVKTKSDTTSSSTVFAQNAFLSASFDSDDYTVKSAGNGKVTDVYLGDDTYVNIANVFGRQVAAVHVKDTNKYYKEADGVLFNKEMTEIAFYPDSKTGPFVLPATVTSIAANLFAGKKQITAITIPASVSSIGENAFMNCSGLTAVTFTDDVGEDTARATRLDIGNRAFYGCSTLKHIELPERTKIIGDEAFAMFITTRPQYGLTSIVLNEGLESIGAKAFQYTALKEVTIPSTVTSLGTTSTTTSKEKIDLVSCEVFGACDMLERITVAPNNKTYMDVDGVLYRRGEVTLSQGGAADLLPTELIYVPMSYHNDSGTLEIPNTVTKIWSNAFAYFGCDLLYTSNPCNITTVKFKDNALAKVYNASTQEMQMPTLTVDPYAFYDVGKVTTIIFPEGYRTLKKVTFKYYDSGSAMDSITSKLTTIELPASLTLIEAMAIRDMPQLTTVKFRDPADGVHPSLVIGDSAANGVDFNVFYGCKQLTTLTLPEGTTEINAYAFGNSNGLKHSYLKSVTLPSTLTKIGRYAFSLLELDRFTFNSSDTASLTIEGFAFIGLKGLQSISLPTVTSIGDNAFAGSTISSIDFGSKLTSIGNQAFQGTALRGVLTFPASLQSIGDNAFLGLSGITEVKFTKPSAVPDGKQRLTIGQYAFNNCVNLAKVNLEDTYLQSLSRDAFRKTRIESAKLPWTISTIDMYAFADNSLLSSVEFLTDANENNGKSCLEKIGDWAFQYSVIGSFSLPESSEDKTTLGKQLFVGCSSLTKVHLSAQVTSITDVFKGCGSIGEITVQEGNPTFSAKPGQKMLFDATGTSVLFVYAEIEGGKLEIADGATEIGVGAFKDQLGLTEVTLPLTLLTIGESAFENCINLTKVTFAGTGWSHLESIGKTAFKNCQNLETVALERTESLGANDRTGIGESAFENCYKLQTVDLSYNASALKQIGKNAFKLAGRDTTDEKPFTVKLPVKLTAFGESAFQGSGLRSIDLSALTSLKGLDATQAVKTIVARGKPGLTTSGFALFKDCAKLTEVKLPESLSTIGTNVFENCTSLKKINLEKVTSIGQYAFHGCAALTGDQPEGYGTDPNVEPNLTFDLSALTSIGKNAFQGSGIVYIKITSKLNTGSSNSANTDLFSDCVSLVRVDVDDTSGTAMKYLPNNIFKGCTALAQFKIPSCVVDIGNNAFDGTALSEVTIPSKVTSIRQYAFRGTNIPSVTIPNTVTTIGVNAFDGCESLKTVTFEDGTTKFSTFSGYIFQNSGVESVVLGNRVTTIPTYMFSGCKSLTSFTIPSTVTTIGGYAFAGSGLTSIHLPKTITWTTTGTTGHQFDGCESLTEVTFEDGYDKAFQTGVFANCTSLTSFAFPDGITATSSNMFQGSGIKSVTWNKVTTIGSYAFQNTQFERLTIPAQITKLNNYAFADCAKLSSVTFETDQTTGKTGVYDLMGHLFSGCGNLQTVKLADGITDLGDNTFDGCGMLIFSARDLPDSFTTLNATLVAMLYGDRTSITVDSRFTTIGEKAFQKNTTVTSITLPSTVLTIGSNAFEEATLTSITLSNGLQTIGASAFKKTVFTSIEIPSTVTSIGNNAFEGAAITSISIPSSVTTYGDYIFQNSALQSIQLPENMTFIPTKMFYASALKSIVLPSTLQAIEDSVFENCVDLASVDFNGNTTMTELVNWNDSTNKPNTSRNSNYVFKGCTSLTTIELPTSLISIGFQTFQNSGLERIDLSKLTGLKTTMGTASAKASVGTNTALFSGCTNLREVLLPDGLESIVGKVFENTKSLKSITLPQSLTLIGNNAFDGSGITSVNIPDKVTTLGTSIFNNCSDLEEATIGRGVTALTSNMFTNCTSLKSVSIPAATTTIASNTFNGCGSLSITNESSSFTLDDSGHFLMKGSTIYALADGGNLSEATLTIPTNLNITDQQFFSGTKVKQLTFAEGYTAIPKNLFYGIEAEEVVLPESLATINGTAFSNAKIGKMTIPATVATIAANAFQDATIGELTFEGTYASPTASVFKGAKIGKINFAAGSSIGVGWFENATLSEEFTLDNVATIGKTAFKNAVIEGTLHIPTCVTTIGGGAFTNLTLDKVSFDMGAGDPLTIENGSSASETLFGTTKFETITLPDRLVSLGNYAFASNTELTHITLPASLTTIGNYAFSGCTALGSIELPTGFTTLGTYAFSGCSALTSVKLPETVISIGTSAFSNCKEIKSIYIPLKVGTLSSSVFSGWDDTQTVYLGMSRYTFVQLFGLTFYTGAKYNLVFDFTMEEYEALQSAQG